MHDVDDLLNRYELRKKAEQADAEAREELERQRAKQAVRFLYDIAVPVLNDLAAHIDGKNHHMADVRDTLKDATLTPSVELLFRPWPALMDSKLTIKRQIDTDDVTMLTQVNSSAKIDHGNGQTYALSDLSENIVRGAAMAFVKSVLDAN